MNEFSFCPHCKSEKIQYVDGKKWLCPNCGFDLYNNVASAVGAIIFDSEGNILLEVRAKEPKKGYLALPGGFCNYDESAEEAVVRECKEETGLSIDNISYLCSFPNDYEYKGIAYKTCDLFFTAPLPKESGTIDTLIHSLSEQKSEVISLKAHKVNSNDDINALPLAFESAHKALSFWLKKRTTLSMDGLAQSQNRK